MALAYGVALPPYLHCKLMVCVVRHYPRLCLVAGGLPLYRAGWFPPFPSHFLCALKAFITKPYAA